MRYLLMVAFCAIITDLTVAKADAAFSNITIEQPAFATETNVIGQLFGLVIGGFETVRSIIVIVTWWNYTFLYDWPPGDAIRPMLRLYTATSVILSLISLRKTSG